MDRVPHTVPVTDAAPVEPFQRVEVITGIARRRRWSDQDKARIVAESSFRLPSRRKHRLRRAPTVGSRSSSAPSRFGSPVTSTLQPYVRSWM
jgi:hypothetical protein